MSDSSKMAPVEVPLIFDYFGVVLVVMLALGILDRYVWWKKNVELKSVYNFDTHTYYKFFPSSEQTDQRTRKRLTNGPNHVEVREYWDKSASQYSQVILHHWCCLIVYYHFSLQTLVLCSSVMMLGQQQKQAAHYIASQAASMVDAA